ncbi:PAS domain S-box protein [Myxococcota bacterium]|nr:PAS domain S-box protein [Myxococcota bacterium]MBU1534769.1 PAS domain S-box protein [Myxococcota bacterium]
MTQNNIPQEYELRIKTLEEQVASLQHALLERETQFSFSDGIIGAVALEPIALLDRELRFLEINRRFEELLGVKDDIRGTQITSMTGIDDLVALIGGCFSRCLAGETCIASTWVESPSLGKRYFDIHMYPYKNTDDSVQSVFVFGYDLTGQHESEEALRESKEKYQLLFELESDAIFLIEKESGNILEVNSAATKLYGYSREELLTMKNTDLSAESEKTTQATREKHVTIPVRYHKKRDGTVIQVEITAKHLVYKGVEAHIAAIRDISFRIEAEQHRLKLERELNQVQKMHSIGTLAGGIAHDFNNILGILMGNISHALSLLPPDHELSPMLQDALKGSTWGQSLTHQLLTFAKGGEPIKKVCNINHLIGESARFVTSGASSRCEFSLCEDLNTAWVDPDQFKQVMGNLIINADQAMPGGGIIAIRTEHYWAENESDFPLKAGKYIKVTVEDSGVGILPNLLPNVFDPYFTTKQKGSGLGLATAFSIISHHEGHITVSSTVGKGTIFTLYLPVAVGKEEPDVSHHRSFHSGHGRVLVVDDQDALLRMMSRMLERFGYEAALANDGKKALDMYKEALESGARFDLVILDLTIPGGMGGAETIRALRKMDPEVKAIVSSGYSTDPVMAKYEEYGFCGVMPKPFTREQLSEVLDSVFHKND